MSAIPLSPPFVAPSPIRAPVTAEPALTPHPPARHSARAIVREYLWTTCCATLDPAPGETFPPLRLPHLLVASFTDADLYTAGPGLDDQREHRHLIPSHDPVSGEPDAIYSRSPEAPLSHSDTTGTQILRLSRMRQLLASTSATPTQIVIECGTVMDIINTMAPEDRQTLGEIVQRVSTRRLARRTSTSVAGVHRQRSRALDRLVAVLYARSAARG